MKFLDIFSIIVRILSSIVDILGADAVSPDAHKV